MYNMYPNMPSMGLAFVCVTKLTAITVLIKKSLSRQAQLLVTFSSMLGSFRLLECTRHRSQKPRHLHQAYPTLHPHLSW